MPYLALVVLLLTTTVARADASGDSLERRAAAWLASPPPIANVRCALSCHTTLPFMLAGPTGSVRDELRAALVARVDAPAPTPWYGAAGSERARQSHATESVVNAVALVFDDDARGNGLQPATRRALARMWSTQRADGGWDWLEFGLEPWQAGEDWGATMAALVARRAPRDPDRLARLVAHLRARLPAMKLHDRATLLWANAATPIVTRREADVISRAITRTQHADGGFSIVEWTDAASRAPADGYATAIAVLALCRTGGARTELGRAVAWLRDHAGPERTWPGRSANHTGERARLFMTDAATGYARLALQSCSLDRAPHTEEHR